jgi:hypothetical protein
VYGIILAFIFYKENAFLSKWFFIGFGVIAIALIIHVILLVRIEKKITNKKDKKTEQAAIDESYL